MQIDEKFMMRCLELAKCGRSTVAPNPMVGAVIVHQGRIIGEGFHRVYGDAHAEINAIQAVEDESLLRDSTLYVSLEPCVHIGKTPPCVNMIVEKRIPRVVVACIDPNPKVSGKGIQSLREAGVEVVQGVMEQEAIELNRFFMTAHTKQRPYVILKWAQSRDGYMDGIRNNTISRQDKATADKASTIDLQNDFNTSVPVILSNAVTFRHLHKLRTEISAIMVGTNTALMDNPLLTVRHWIGKSPVRVCIDRTRRIPLSHHLLDGSIPTLIFTSQNTIHAVEENSENIEYIPLDFSQPVLIQILQDLYERKLYSLLVEGGARLHASFFNEKLWDELQIETSPLELRGGVKSPACDLSEIAVFQKYIDFSSDTLSGEPQSFISVYTCNQL
ncbi:MAG: bifunctional diaminohydroxyphosphoribosylaminopyrimidine deaminase/5-amino-6-(5-phosphoribosylamino)uracil reductase RibD [Tannerella sp.]|jgi:diaminohydroxyphosphoribosylaminopyrimidine deaminase/5-amino-6-(5-phosphoribosylamino)uracil reductase|nr:bifunctional diaminohydroxyphosphoribosylaminopyrimidine deaminase/5-amino-6-(5-phosphoribosylamino)uracil reductase RibD [Tannerella sp.]